MLVSIHIPKTGGTSLRNTLQRKYDKGLRFDYPDLPIDLRQKLKRLLSKRPLAIHGHFPASKYSGAKITFLRDPFERRISTYHYIHRHHEQHGFIANEDWELALSSSLDTYVETPSFDYQYYLDVPVEEFAFIGQMYRFDQDMERLSKALGVPYKNVFANKAPKVADLPVELRKKFERANPGELDTYERFVKRADALLKHPELQEQSRF